MKISLRNLWITKAGIVSLLTLGASFLNAQTTNSNNLTVLGYVDATNEIFYGNAVSGGVTNSAVSLNYSDALHEVGLLSSQPSSIFLWQDNGASTSSNKMKLDGSNNLTLYSTNGSNGIVLNPTTGGLQLKGTGAGITLVDGTLINSSNSLHSSGLYNSTGTEIASVDANGNLDINSPVQIAGSGNGINFANGSTLNAGNVAYLNQTLTNLGYQSNTVYPDAFYNLPNSSSISYVAVDGSGNTYITGTLLGSATIGLTTLTASGRKDVFVIKLNAAAVPQWAQSFGGSGGSDNPNGITVDQNGNVYVVGSYTAPITNGINGQTLNTSGSRSEFVVAYNSSGNVRWATGFGGGNNWPAGIAVDSNGNVDVTGYYGSPITTGLPAGSGPASTSANSTFLVQFSSSGSVNWAQGFGTSGAWPAGIALDGSGNVYIAGGYSVDASSGDVLIAKYNNAGSQQWEKTFGGGSDNPLGVAVDQSSNSYILGSYYKSINDGFSLRSCA